MYKCLFTKWKMLGKYHVGFAFSIITTQWALPLNIEWNKYKLFISILCFNFTFDKYKIKEGNNAVTQG